MVWRMMIDLRNRDEGGSLEDRENGKMGKREKDKVQVVV
jgi:hypothetical protein